MVVSWNKGEIVFKFAILCLTLILITGCTDLSSNSDTPLDMSDQTEERQETEIAQQEELRTMRACRDFELSVIDASQIFGEVLSRGGFATTGESKQFFDELSDFSGELIEISFSENEIAQVVRDGANVAAQAVGEVQGLLSNEFDPSEVGELLREELIPMTEACEEFTASKIEVAKLFESPEVQYFSIEATDDPSDDPIAKKFESVGINCEFLVGPVLVDPKVDFEGEPQAKLDPYVRSICWDKNTDTFYLMSRHSNSVQANFAAQIYAEIYQINQGEKMYSFFDEQFALNVSQLGDGSPSGVAYLFDMTQVR